MRKNRIEVFGVGIVLLVAIVGWMSTAPYLSNQGLGRIPGVIIGGTMSEPPGDFTTLNGTPGPLMMKQAGFPPLVIYLMWVGTPSGIITATRPDGGYWAQRVRERGGEGLLRIGDQTFEMTAHEIVGNERLAMIEEWAAKAGRTLDEPVYEGTEPLRDWEVFFWTPRIATDNETALPK
jgi:hypothetical protein